MQPITKQEAASDSNGASRAPLTHGVDFRALRNASGNETVTAGNAPQECLRTEHLSLYYGEKRALNNINLIIPEKRVTAFKIGRAHV